MQVVWRRSQLFHENLLKDVVVAFVGDYKNVGGNSSCMLVETMEDVVE